MILALLGALALLVVRAMVKDTILETHTAFLFSQIEMELPDSVKSIPSSAGDTNDWNELTTEQYRILANKLREIAPLDWNSCSLDGSTILDGWKRKCIVECRNSPAPSIRLISYGRDGVKQTEDDIVREIEINNGRNAEP